MRQWESLIGRRFGSLEVTGQASSDCSGKRRWNCRCDCGRNCQAVGYDLTHGRKTSCGCRRRKDLAGSKMGRLTVLELSEEYGSRGSRRVRLWRCRCDCGTITYKATDTLNNPDLSMCGDCAARYGIVRARERLGYTEGTQISRICNTTSPSNNSSGIRGVYFESKTGRYRARIKFQGRLHDLGSYCTLEEAAAARQAGEKRFFGAFLEERMACELEPQDP